MLFCEKALLMLVLKDVKPSPSFTLNTLTNRHKLNVLVTLVLIKDCPVSKKNVPSQIIDVYIFFTS